MECRDGRLGIAKSGYLCAVRMLDDHMSFETVSPCETFPFPLSVFASRHGAPEALDNVDSSWKYLSAMVPEVCLGQEAFACTRWHRTVG